VALDTSQPLGADERENLDRGQLGGGPGEGRPRFHTPAIPPFPPQGSLAPGWPAQAADGAGKGRMEWNLTRERNVFFSLLRQCRGPCSTTPPTQGCHAKQHRAEGKEKTASLVLAG